MIEKINKKILLLAVVALLALFSAYILTKPAEQAKADSTYSEAWIIKKSWTWTKDISATIRGRVAADSCTSPDQTLDFSFNTFSVTGSGVADCRIKLNNQEISIHTSNGSPYFGYPCKGMNMSYDSWVVGSGTITFFQDTSATEYSELRTWLNTNADKVETPAPESCVVKFYNGATLMKTINVDSGSSALGLDLGIIPSKTNYTFKGWSKAEGGAVVDLANEMIIADTTYYAVFEINKYTVKFRDMDLVLRTVTVDHGTYISTVIAGFIPSKTGYTFKGWGGSPVSSVLDLSNETITADTTYYAIFEINKYTVTFKNDSGVLKTATVNYGTKADKIDLTGVSPEKTGYTFKGWSKTNGGSVVNLANETITADTTYYVVFEINKYSITFNDGTSVLKTVTANYGTKASEINVSTFAPEKEGYTFKGWSKTNGGEVVDLSTVTINQSMAFFAVYEKQTFEIKFMDGETLLKTVTVDYGTNLSAISLTGVSTDKTGFTFRGWALSNGGTVVNSETYSVKSAVNFYAVYDVAGKATVVFKNGATSLKTVTVDLGAKASEIDLSDLELEKNGYTFKGWARSENGIIVDLETVSVNEYTIFYAVYEKDSTDTNISSDNVTKIFGVVGLIALGAVLGGVLFKKRR